MKNNLFTTLNAKAGAIFIPVFIILISAALWGKVITNSASRMYAKKFQNQQKYNIIIEANDDEMSQKIAEFVKALNPSKMKVKVKSSEEILQENYTPDILIFNEDSTKNDEFVLNIAKVYQKITIAAIGGGIFKDLNKVISFKINEKHYNIAINKFSLISSQLEAAITNYITEVKKNYPEVQALASSINFEEDATKQAISAIVDEKIKSQQTK